MEKTLMQKATIFSTEFDFTSGEQKEILHYLQVNNYRLLGYKGASGPNQVSSGVPTWFSMPYVNMFGRFEIYYEPRYKVYVFNKGDITINTTITMHALSDEVSLGTKVVFNTDGSFHSDSVGSEEVITVYNSRPAGTSPITIGLAVKVNGQFLPFCAFTCAAQGTVSIQPDAKIALFAAQSNMTSGSVADHIINPGCSFMWNAKNTMFDLQMIPETYGIENVPGRLSVEPVSPGSSLLQLFNIF
ncbi:hypothetical protein DRF65_07045 [Chryseobacterium pennae]|uniref:Uncharacterized protein n=1 Tax=Chryseobacterium pennae TaxID=2258962 RepID=A0A3D9CAT1_9FLAO|nr:hypothetical protein [Chryseobacterium pennae]REC62983.1 hypothetical protein DRF65_07045 [Chryseobacterium pennae]